VGHPVLIIKKYKTENSHITKEITLSYVHSTALAVCTINPVLSGKLYERFIMVTRITTPLVDVRGVDLLHLPSDGSLVNMSFLRYCFNLIHSVLVKSC